MSENENWGEKKIHLKIRDTLKKYESEHEATKNCVSPISDDSRNTSKNCGEFENKKAENKEPLNEIHKKKIPQKM